MLDCFRFLPFKVSYLKRSITPKFIYFLNPFFIKSFVDLKLKLYFICLVKFRLFRNKRIFLAAHEAILQFNINNICICLEVFII